MKVTSPKEGIVYAATGPDIYSQLAARSAQSLRAINPNLEIDLFTDKPFGTEGVFDQVHILEDPWHRSKIDALRLSRFERTLMLDCDTMIVADIMPVLQGLERFDIAVAYDYRPNGFLNYQVWKHEVPPSMPQFNSGVIGLRKSELTTGFLEDWAKAVRDHDMGRDQPTFRELLYHSDLRILTLPEAFNLLESENIQTWDEFALAPRVIHSPEFHIHFDHYSTVSDPVRERLGLRLSWKRQLLHGSDRSLAKAEDRPPRFAGRAEPVRRLLWMMRHLPSRLQNMIRLKQARSQKKKPRKKTA